MALQGFPAPLVNQGAQIASTAAINTTVSETNLWDPSIQTPIPALDMQAGKVYIVEFGGVIGTTATPTIVFTLRVGTSSTPASNTSLGASATVTTGTITTQPYHGRAVVVVRSVGIAASGATVTGNGTVWLPAAAAATVTPHVEFGGTVATTLNHTIAQGICVSVTWGTSSASNTNTNQWTFAQSQN